MRFAPCPGIGEIELTFVPRSMLAGGIMPSLMEQVARLVDIRTGSATRRKREVDTILSIAPAALLALKNLTRI
jgi:hypothetical protein